jgi:hypothetical protein
MKSPFRSWHNGASRGDVCTIRLLLLCVSDQGPTGESSVRNIIETAVREHVSASLEPVFTIKEILFARERGEILLTITAARFRLSSYDTLAKTFDLLVSHLKTSLSWTLERRGVGTISSAQWCAEPPLIRSQLQSSDLRKSFLEALQNPLALLLIGTILGSVLIPKLNDISNRNKLRHEERIKLALMIVEQSHETDRRLSSLMDYLVLFRKDHTDGSETKSQLKKEQWDARKSFNEMYISFNSQAWWWHWNVKSESSLSALATPEETQTIAKLDREYSDSLLQCTDAVTQLWDPFLKNQYDPKNPENDRVIATAHDSLAKARTRRNQVALEMARVFASK